MEKFDGTSDNEKQIEVLNIFFTKRIPTEEKENRLEKVLDYIHAMNGGISLADIEQNSPYSRKILERYFKKTIGLSHKVYIQIYRFKCLVNFLQANPGITWVQLANQTGYYDQSHMSRYVREYMHVSPNSIVKLDMELIHYLMNR